MPNNLIEELKNYFSSNLSSYVGQKITLEQRAAIKKQFEKSLVDLNPTYTVTFIDDENESEITAIISQ
jgi:uncharacterized protein Veg